jgi:hypothetical protein
MESIDELTLDAAILRQLAEAASGIRDKDLYFVVRRGASPGSDMAFEILYADPGTVPDATVIRCRTARITPDKPVSQLALTMDSGAVSENLAKIADAVFWSESALQKFAVPYYASVGGDRALSRIADLITTFSKSDVAAMVHLPKSDYTTVQSLTHRGALEDFFGVIEDRPPLDGSPVKVIPLRNFLEREQR